MKDKEKRDKFIGVRLTKSQKSEIKDIATQKGLKVAEFMRNAIFGYIKDIEQSVKKVDPVKVAVKIISMKKSLEFINENINIIENDACEDIELVEVEDIYD